MADHYIGVNRGTNLLHEVNYVRGTSTGSTDLEVRLADAAGWTRQEVIDALNNIAELLASPSNLTVSKYPPK